MLIHWTFNPVMMSFGSLTVHWYGLLFVGAFATGQLMLGRFFKAEGVAPENADHLLLYALLGTVVGARLAHCLFYDPHYYLANPLAILRVWEGGLASHGGAVGMLAGLWICSRSMRPRKPFLWLVDRVAIAAALGAVFVRLANFLNSEIVGIPTSGHWGVVFTAVDALPRHPVQLYEAATYLLIFFVLLATYLRSDRQPPHGQLLGWFMLLVFTARIALEFFKVHQAVYANGQIFNVGQYLSLPFVALGALLLLNSKRHPSELEAKKRDG